MGISRELEEYLRKLGKEVTLCKNEARRAIERATETGELFFRINEEKMDNPTFLRALLQIMQFKCPVVGVMFVFTELEKQAPILIEKIENTLDFMQSIPGARIPEAPKDYEEIKKGIKYCYPK